MNNRIEWDLMKPEAIEIRPAQVKDGKVTLLAYQNGRNTMDALDKQFGEFGWKVEYKDVSGQIYGRLSIKDPETGEWIYKEDTGEESNISASKGQSTDILKRLAVRFGYGRELYSIPKIVVDDDGYGNHLKVSEVSWDENRNCTKIVLTNRFGKVMFSWVKDDNSADKSGKSNCDVLKEFCSAKKTEEGIDKDELLKFWNYYCEKVTSWGSVNPEKLWNKWLENKEKLKEKDGYY